MWRTRGETGASARGRGRKRPSSPSSSLLVTVAEGRKGGSRDRRLVAAFFGLWCDGWLHFGSVYSHSGLRSSSYFGSNAMGSIGSSWARLVIYDQIRPRKPWNLSGDERRERRRRARRQPTLMSVAVAGGTHLSVMWLIPDSRSRLASQMSGLGFYICRSVTALLAKLTDCLIVIAAAPPTTSPPKGSSACRSRVHCRHCSSPRGAEVHPGANWSPLSLAGNPRTASVSLKSCLAC
jgi:hypothetical protein